MDAQANDAPQMTNPATNDKKKGKRRKKLVRKIILWVLLILILALAGLIAYSRLKQEYTVTYQPYNATIGTISNSLSFSGTLQAVDDATYTAPISATVRTVYVAKGADVKEGDRLIRLNNGTVIEAEFDGRVNQLPVAEGDKVSSGDTLVQVVDFRHMKVSIRVDEYDISDVKRGDAVKITTTATEKTFTSVIDDINYVSSSTGNVAYYTATAYVDVDEGVYPGMQVTVTVPQEEAANVVILKEDALSFDGRNQAFVYTMTADGEMAETYVKTGVSNGNYVEITEGLRSGDTVYAVVTTQTASGLYGMFSNMFGTRRVLNNGGNTRQNYTPGGNSWNGGGTNRNGGGR